ncbi:MAG: TIGR04255 family protein [Chitinophagaceae bacterium]|nr:TIGR04255 family protein [Chitinophagaceae bacterium]
MSSLIEKIKPFSGRHSIKEATISTFLVNQIIKPERFQKLIETTFKNKFKQFTTLEQVQVQIQKKGEASIVNTNTVKNTGFRFSGFNEKGKNTIVFQGLNEERRKFLSFHYLEYNTWAEFYKDYSETIVDFTGAAEDLLFVNSFSLQYVDVFNWTGTTDEFIADLIFNRSSQILPAKFFESKFSRTYLLTIEQEFEGLKFLDRIEIKIENKILPEITISHNVAHQLDNEQELSSLVKESNFNKMLTIAHRRNKETLGDILNEDIKRLINL